MADIGPKIGVQGEAEFKRQIKDINGTLGALAAETKKVASEFIGSEKSMEALSKQTEVLQRNSEALNQKLDLQKKHLQELDEQGVDPTSAQYQKLQKEIFQTEEKLNKNEAAIKQNEKAMDGLGDETEDVADAMKDGGDKALKFGDVLKADLLSDAIIGGVKMLADGLKKVVGTVVDAAYAADDLNTLAKTTGLTTTELQKFQFASENIDVSVDTLTGSMTKLIKNMASAESGSGAAYEAFQKLGVEIQNSDGTFRDRNDVFNETIAALGQITDETERDVTAMSLFGKSAQDLNPLILGGADALKELGDKAEAAGLILSQDDLDALNGVADAMDTFKATAEAAGQAMLVQFAGPVSEAINTATDLITGLVDSFKEGGVKGVLEYCQSIIDTFVEEGLPTAMTLVTNLANDISASLPQLIPAAVETIMSLVGKLTDPESKMELFGAALSIIKGLAQGILNAIPVLVQQAPVIIGNLVAGLVGNLWQLLTFGGDIVRTLATSVSNMATEIMGIGRKIVEGIFAGIKNKADWFKRQVKDFFGGIITTVKELLGIHSPSTVFAGIGRNMALGIGEGWEDAMGGVERGMTAAMPSPTLSIGNAVSGALAANGGSFGGSIVLNITSEIDGAVLARSTYNYNRAEAQRMGAALVQGV